jgi:hypothetical protein
VPSSIVVLGSFKSDVYLFSTGIMFMCPECVFAGLVQICKFKTFILYTNSNN